MSGSTILSLALTSPLSSLPPPPSSSSTSTSCCLYSSPIFPQVAIPASKRLHPNRLHLHTNPSSGVHCLNVVIPKAASSSDIDNTTDSPAETPDEKVTVDKLPLETKLQERMEQKLKMKLAKKIRLRRKRLVLKMAEKTMAGKERLCSDADEAANGVVKVNPKPKGGLISKVVDYLEKLIVKLMYDPSQPLHYLSGNFAPVDESPPIKDLPVKGHLPLSNRISYDAEWMEMFLCSQKKEDSPPFGAPENGILVLAGYFGALGTELC